MPATDLKMLPRNADGSRPGLPFPSELICDILEHLRPIDLLAVGQTCRQLLEEVNANAESFGERIVCHERARIMSRLPISDFVLPGMSLLDAAHRLNARDSRDGIVPPARFSMFANMVVHGYVSAHDDFRHDWDDKRVLKTMLTYLFDLTRKIQPPTPRRDLNMRAPLRRALTKQTPATAMIIEKCIWEREVFAATAVDSDCINGDDPCDFFRRFATPWIKERMSREEWICAIQSMFTEPLTTSTVDERSEAHTAWLYGIWMGFGNPSIKLSSVMDVFLEITGLTALPEGNPRCSCRPAYVPRSEKPVRGQTWSKKEKKWQYNKDLILGVRATREFCSRMYGPLYGKTKLLDPAHRLLLAVVYEELDILPAKEWPFESWKREMARRTNVIVVLRDESEFVVPAPRRVSSRR